MSDVRLVVREAGREWSGIVHGGSADRAIAALGADPVTLEELEAACARFERPAANRPFLASLRAGSCDEPYDGGIVVIDLVARLVVVDSTSSSPGPTGAVCYHDGQGATDTWLRYHLAEDWLFTGDGSRWRAVAEERCRERAARPLLDVRGVFYGRPFLEYIARETFAASARRVTDEELIGETLKDIHAAWLLTPRDDLGGACPRDVALERRDHLAMDLQDQCDRWSGLGECPPGLDRSSFAFRHGGFGTHELVLYYELVRELLWSCWERLAESGERSAASGPEAPTLGDHLTGEIPRLEHVRDDWLDRPDPEFHGRTPRSIIDRERTRLPEGMSGHEAVIDPDCPCCQMVADGPGPVFWHLDSSEMDVDFAFDLDHRTREEWEAEQRRWEDHRRRFNAEWAERERLGVAHSGFGQRGEGSVWSSSFSLGDAADVPLGVRLFGIGCHLAELIAGLRDDADGSSAPPQAQRSIDELNRHFGNLREILQTSEPSVAEALIRPVIDRLADSLAAVASARPDLSPKCESLTSRLAEFLDPLPSEASGDWDLPF